MPRSWRNQPHIDENTFSATSFKFSNFLKFFFHIWNGCLRSLHIHLLIKAGKNVRHHTLKKINKPVPSGWCLYSTFTYRDVPDPLRLYRGKNCVKTFIDHIKDEIN